MSDFLSLAPAWAGGVFLGAMFYAGLWWTVRRGISSRRAALWFAGSLSLRMAVTLAGFYLVSAGHWDRLLPCLLGFAMARVAVTRLTRPSRPSPPPEALERSHAP